MALLERSCFYYGHTVTLSNKYLDIDEGSGVISVEIPEGSYSATDFCAAVSTAVNAVATNDWLFTLDRDTRKITITVSVASDILGSTGPNVANSINSLLGLASVDYLNFTSLVAPNGTGSEYVPQFPLQDYLPSSVNKKAYKATVIKSASGNEVTVQSFGTEVFMRCNIKYITNIIQPNDDVIVSESDAVEKCVQFLEYAITKGPMEYMPRVGSRSSFEKVILEATQSNQDGIGYELRELYSTGLPEYYETGTLTFKVLT